MNLHDIKKIFSLLFLVVAGLQLNAQVTLSADLHNDKEGFNLLSAAAVFVDADDRLAVKTAASLFADDIQRVSGKKLPVKNAGKKFPPYMIVAGTIDNNRLIKELANNKKLNTDSLTGQWERYIVRIIQNPFPNVKAALVIAGSDQRGTAYGLFEISEVIGVSPWYWWADVPVVKKNKLILNVHGYTSKTPSVKYRGIFINDEDWGLLRWAKRTFEPELNDIGPGTYRKVFELLLRLKANYLVPAMHEASGYFNKYPESKFIADTFGIIMGSAHPEPLLFNNASEWDEKTMGPWNYMTNKKNIIKALDKRVSEIARFENVYTIALRGIHDRAMEGNYSMDQRVELLESAIQDQRNILKTHIDKPIEEIPQAFTPYKEVLDIYQAGLKLPDDITIVWPDDNYGYMKRLSNPAEQKRSGRSGVYYHASYLGSPHDYLWLGTTPPNLMYEELHKAYHTGADRLWLLNSGDIKSCEGPVTQFLAMAYDINAFDFQNTPLFQAKWLSKIYGDKYYSDLVHIATKYNHLAFTRKPEFMGWGYEWNTHKHGRERPTDTDFSFSNYREAERRISEYEEIANRAESIMNNLNEYEKPSFYQLVYYPVKGAELMNKMRLTGQKNRWYAFQGRSLTNELRKVTREYYDSLQIITKRYNSLLNGKWNHMMSMVQGVTASYFELPKTDSITLTGDGTMELFVEGSEPTKGVNNHYALPAFNVFTKRKYFIDVYNTGTSPVVWNATADAGWIELDKTSGKTAHEARVWISIDWKKVPKGEKVAGSIIFTSGTSSKKVAVSVLNPVSPGVEELEGKFVEDNGYISIPGADFHHKVENKQVKMQIIDHLGFEDRSVMMGDPTSAIINPKRSDAPFIAYDFYSFNYGSVDVYTYVLPVFPLTSDRDLGFHESSNQQTKYAICIDDGPIATPSSSAPEYSQTWSENVLRNAAINKSVLHIDKPGWHTLKIKTGDPGMVIQKIVIDFGGMKRSYLGPPSTMVKQ